MRIGKFPQDPNERKRYTIDYEAWLDVNEQLTSVVFVVSPTTTPPLVVSGVAIEAGNKKVSFFVEGGLHSTDYRVQVTVQTDGGQVKEDHIKYVLRNQ